jgi:glutamine amidotransferase
LHSVAKAFAKVGAEVELADHASALESAHHLVLPGVGAFGEGMAELGRRGLIEPLRAHTAAGRPLLGICLGAQLLMEGSEEFGWHAGLGLIPGDVRRLPEGGGKIPHVGWARIYPPDGITWEDSPLAETPAQTWTYFVHSFQCHPANSSHVFALAPWGTHELTAAVRCGSVVGVQFHPEKSGAAGLAMLRQFLGIAPAAA